MNEGTQQANGFLNLYKPAGLTSMEALRQVKRLTASRNKVGHGGTLDPLAEGVLPICFGQATRLMEYLVNDTKAYRLDIRLGVTTDTYDAEGEVVRQRDPAGVTEEKLPAALKAFQGVLYQVPPMYSALKVKGQRLYELARQGVEVERQPRKVEITSLTLVEFRPPVLVLDVQCGRGAYMRSLAHDLGEALGCGAHLAALVRQRSGPFRAEEAVSLAQLQEATDQKRWQGLLRPMDFLLLDMKGVVVNKAAERLVRNGQSISLGSKGWYAGHLESYRIYTTEGYLLGVMRFDRSQNQWNPYKVFGVNQPSPYAPKAGQI